MHRTRVVLMEMSRILSRIVREAVAEEQDMEVVDDFPDSSPLRGDLDCSKADVVVVGHDLADADVTLLSACTDVAVLALAEDGRKVLQYKLRKERMPLATDDAELSTQGLVEAIRAAAKGSI